MATVTVTINGVEYNLKGHEDGEYLKKVAEYVEEKTQEMATKNNKLSARISILNFKIAKRRNEKGTRNKTGRRQNMKIKECENSNIYKTNKND